MRLFCLIWMLVGLPLTAQAEWYQQEQSIMGTNIRVELWSENKEAGAIALASVMDEMRRIDRLMSPYKTQSELSFVNNNASLCISELSVSVAFVVAIVLFYLFIVYDSKKSMCSIVKAELTLGVIDMSLASS